MEGKSVIANNITGRVEPYIYGFTTPQVLACLKVGDTYRPLNVRIEEWRRRYEGIELVCKEPATVAEDTFFRDYAVHEYLTRHGFERKEREEFEAEKIAWNRIQQEKSKDLKEKIEDLLRIQSGLSQSNNIPSYMNINSSNYKNEEECSKLKSEIENLKFIFNSKVEEFEVLKNNFTKEKNDFDIFSNSIRNEIKLKQSVLEKESIELLNKESDIEKRKLNLNQKENELILKKEDFNKIKNFVREQHNKNLRDEEELEKAEYRKNLFYGQLLEEENQIGEEKSRVNEEMNNVGIIKEEIININREIDQINQEINSRMNFIDDLCGQNIIKKYENMDSLTNVFFMNNKMGKNKIENGGKVYERNNDKLSDNKLNNDNFNSQLYLLKLKNRLDVNKIKLDQQFGLTSKKFDPIKEKEYLNKCIETLNKIKK